MVYWCCYQENDLVKYLHGVSLAFVSFRNSNWILFNSSIIFFQIHLKTSFAVIFFES